MVATRGFERDGISFLNMLSRNEKYIERCDSSSILINLKLKFKYRGYLSMLNKFVFCLLVWNTSHCLICFFFFQSFLNVQFIMFLDISIFFCTNYESREGTNFPLKHVLYNNTFHNFLQLELLQLTFIVKTALKDLLSPSL